MIAGRPAFFARCECGKYMSCQNSKNETNLLRSQKVLLKAHRNWPETYRREMFALKMNMPNPMPSSSNVNVYDEWNKDWINIAFEEVIKRWRKE